MAEADELRTRLRSVARSLEGLAFVPGTAAERREAAALARARRLVVSKLLPELERGFAPPLVAVVAGGTNVGKSTLFNSLLGRAVSSVDARAGHTAHPVVAGPASGREAVAALLPGASVQELPEAPSEHPSGPGTDAGAPTVFYAESGSPGGVVLIDSPDIDSALKAHHSRAFDSLIAADVFALVASPTKYNDKRCVEFLLDAAAMGKRAVVLFNLLPRRGASRAEVLEDFRRNVLGRLPKGAPEPELFEFDFVPDLRSGGAGAARALDERTGPARAYLEGEASRAREVKRAVTSGGARYLLGALGGPLKALKGQAASLDAVRGDLETAAARAAADYEAFVRAQEFLDLELVLKRLLDRFRVPVLDDVLDLASALPRWIARAVLRQRTLDERRKAQGDLSSAKGLELAVRVRGDFAHALESRASDEVAKKLYREIVSVDYFGRDLGAAWSAGAARRQGVLDSWLASFEGELASRIEGSPGVRVTLQSLKAMLELGAGIGAAVLTGGIGRADLLIAPAATKAAQMVLERFGRELFSRKREEYVALARGSFTEGMDEVLVEGLRGCIPSSPSAEDVSALEGDVKWLARAFASEGMRRGDARRKGASE
ncbi:MAG: GTPase [Planctomycetota bacterium]|jgi:hypothetical protein